MSRYRTEVRIRFSDVDRAGIAYYPRVLHLFHVAMEDFFEEFVGIPYAKVLSEDGLGFPAVKLETEFDSPLRFGERLGVEVWVEKLGRSSLVLRFRIVGPEDDTRARARITVVCVGLEGLKPVAIPDAYRERLGAAVEAGKKGDGE